jgi:hypothetical protein
MVAIVSLERCTGGALHARIREKNDCVLFDLPPTHRVLSSRRPPLDDFACVQSGPVEGVSENRKVFG